MDAKERCRGELSRLLGTAHVQFTRRGNESIKLALRLAKRLRYRKLLLQDQGGWMTYDQFAEKEKLQVTELVTDYGLVDPEDLVDFDEAILMINSMPGYHALQDMEKITELCARKNIFLINDASGSIGTKSAEHGDVIFGSFGEDKPVDLGAGGFIAFRNEEHFKMAREIVAVEPDLDYDRLLEVFNYLPARLKSLHEIRNRAAADLEAHSLLHPEREGINLIALFSSEDEKQTLINYCARKRLEHTICPRKIRVLADAISIEIKRVRGVAKWE